MATQRFKEKNVLITGGNSGIGLATAKAFYEEGAQVIITGRDQATLDSAVDQIGEGTIAIRADVSRLADLDDLMAQVAASVTHLNVLIANAGISKFYLLEHMSEDAFDEQVAVNFKGVYYTVQKSLPLLISGSTIILNASIGTRLGIPTASVYNATKAAVRSLGRSFAAELIPRGIRVNVVSPGTILTPILGRAEGIDPASINQTLAYYADKIPLKRVGQPDEVARAILFLASEDASYIIGTELVIDGGLVEL